MSEATDRLVAVLREFGEGSLRDVWLFDQWASEQLYVRDDVTAVVADLDTEKAIDNERYGYITRDTYEAIYGERYEYTVRGIGEFEQLRTFLSDRTARIGLFAGFDRVDGGRDYAELHAEIQSVVVDYPIEEFTPASFVN
jgi:hypothetical protein